MEHYLGGPQGSETRIANPHRGGAAAQVGEGHKGVSPSPLGWVL